MAAATMYVTPAGAGDKSGSTWANAMGTGEWETDLLAGAEAGDIYYVLSGTYTLTQAMDFSARVGTTANPIQIIGVDNEASPVTTADWAYSTDRPLIAAAANAFRAGNYTNFKNFRMTTTDANGFHMNRGHHYNLASLNESTTDDRYAFNLGSEASGIGFDAESQDANNGRGIAASTGVLIMASYIHDCAGIGVAVMNAGVRVINSVVDTCGVGISCGTREYLSAINSTIYNCTTGISGNTASGTFLNNIIDACTTGASWTTENAFSIWDYNCWDNTGDVTNVTKGPHAVTGDPGLNDPANGDFSITSGDANVYNVALDAGDLTGATV